MLPRKNRLHPNRFKQVFNKGKKTRGEYGMLMVLKGSQGDSQIAFVVSKKIGNAVQRHRMTRLLRDISKEYIERVKNFNMVYVAYKYCNDYEELQKDFSKQFEDTLRNSKEY